MYIHGSPLRLRTLFVLGLGLGLGGCNGSMGLQVDPFVSNTLGSYTIYNTPDAWFVNDGHLNGDVKAEQSVVIRKGASMEDGWVETETDRAADGGLVLRFRSDGNYYLLALRDDSRFWYANIEMYVASDGEFIRIAGPVDLVWEPGVRKTVRFEAVGDVLEASVDGAVVLRTTDDTYGAGGFGLRHDNSRGEKDITSRFDLLRWSER